MKYDFDTILTQLSELLKDKECDTIEFKSEVFRKTFGKPILLLPIRKVELSFLG